MTARQHVTLFLIWGECQEKRWSFAFYHDGDRDPVRFVLSHTEAGALHMGGGGGDDHARGVSVSGLVLESRRTPPPKTACHLMGGQCLPRLQAGVGECRLAS